jgi:hypothetical protein
MGGDFDIGIWLISLGKEDEQRQVRGAGGVGSHVGALRIGHPDVWVEVRKTGNGKNHGKDNDKNRFSAYGEG